MSKRNVKEKAQGEGAFTEAERQIYYYSNGRETVAADPLDIQMRFYEYPDVDFEDDLKIMETLGGKEQAESIRRLEKALRHIFNIPPFPEGLSVSGCFQLFFHYGRFIDALKKNAPDLPTCFTPMEPASDPST